MGDLGSRLGIDVTVLPPEVKIPIFKRLKDRIKVGMDFFKIVFISENHDVSWKFHYLASVHCFIDLSVSAGQDSDGEESDPDLFQCGKCKHMFNSLQKYLKHKAAKDCSVQLQGNRTVVSPVTNGEVR